MASSKLAALQAQIESNAEEIEHEISESQRLVGGGGPAYDPEEGALDQRRTKARRKRAAELEEPEESAVPFKKIALMVGLTALCAVALLLVLFWRSGESPVEKALEEEMKAIDVPIGEDGCPHASGIPKFCEGKDRIKNMSVWDKCQELFEKQGWEMALLKKCGLIV